MVLLLVCLRYDTDLVFSFGVFGKSTVRNHREETLKFVHLPRVKSQRSSLATKEHKAIVSGQEREELAFLKAVAFSPNGPIVLDARRERRGLSLHPSTTEHFGDADEKDLQLPDTMILNSFKNHTNIH